MALTSMLHLGSLLRVSLLCLAFFIYLGCLVLVPHASDTLPSDVRTSAVCPVLGCRAEFFGQFCRTPPLSVHVDAGKGWAEFCPDHPGGLPAM